MKKEITVKVIVFCTIGFLALMLVIRTSNLQDLATSVNEVNNKEINEFSNKKIANVKFSTDEDFNQVKAIAYNLLKYENLVIDNTAILDYEITFNNKSGKVDYIFYIENLSEVDAVLGNFELPNPMCKGFLEDCEKYLEGLTYKLTYEDGRPVTTGDIIEKDSRIKIILTLEYLVDDFNMPSSTATITNLKFNMNFYEK